MTHLETEKYRSIKTSRVASTKLFDRQIPDIVHVCELFNEHREIFSPVTFRKSSEFYESLDYSPMY